MNSIIRHFVLLASSLGNRKSRRLLRNLSEEHNLCKRLDTTLVVNTRDEKVFNTLQVDMRRIPIVLR